MNSAPTLTITTFALALALTQAVDPSHVSACVGGTCNAGAVLPSEGELPENAIELLWRTTVIHNPATAATTPAPTPHLYRVEGDTRTELEITTEEIDGLVHVKPQQTVAAGSTLVFEYDETCGFPAAPGLVSTSFQVGPAAVAPNDIGSLNAEIKQGPVTVNDSGGMCTESIESVYADLTIDLSDEAKPYASALRHRLVVDGTPVQSYGYYDGPYSGPEPIGTSILGTGKDRLVVLCGEYEDAFRPGEVAEGAHRVLLEVLLPDDTMLLTDAIDIDLRCPDPLNLGTDSGDAADADTGAMGGHDGDAPPGSATSDDTDASDGDVAANDGDVAADDRATSPEAATTDAMSPFDAESTADDGCSVSSHGQGASSLWLVALGLIGAAWRRSRLATHPQRPALEHRARR